MSKENDLMLNILENPQFSVLDFQLVGLNAGNTSLELESTYANSPIILNNPAFKTPTGDFDLAKFHNTYIEAQKAYNYMASSEDDGFKATFSKYNIFAPMEERDWSPQFKVGKVMNPDRVTSSLVRIGEMGERELSREEIAQTLKVFDVKTGRWLDAPNDDFFGTLLGDTRVLAQYEKDVDVNGIERGQVGFDENNIEHNAGEYKLNENGTYYYETAGGRSIHGKQVLHLSDILTTDGSALNSVDFFDSDGLDKTPVGSLVKNASLIGAMFLPVVGPWVTGATILLQCLGLGATLGKIALGPDNETLNYIEGLSEATNFMNTRSEYSREHTWSVENLLGMVGDTVGQLRQQRKIFQWAPAMVKGKWGLSEKNQLALKDKYLKELNANTDAILGGKASVAKIQAQKASNAMEAAEKLERYMDSYYKAGEPISKAYMTMLTVNDIYGEALAAGANNFDAALLTSGYAAMEYALLSTDIGKWILPELRANRLRARGVTKALTKETLETWDKLRQEATTPAKKRGLIKRIVEEGKKLARGEFALGKGNEHIAAGSFNLSKAGLGSVFSGALAEGTEEVSEELLGDFSRALFDGLQTLKGSNVQKLLNINDFEGFRDRYLMSFLGGFLGGGISASTIDYKLAKQYGNLTYNLAIQEVVSMTRDGSIKDLYKLIDKETIGNKYLSARKTVTDENGVVVGWAQADEKAKDDQDTEIKGRLRQQLGLIENTLTAIGGKATNDEILEANTGFLNTLRYNALHNTTTAGKFILEFNNLDVEYIGLVTELNRLNSPEVKEQNGEHDLANTSNPDIDEQRSKIQARMEEIKLRLEEMRTGATAAQFMLPALLEVHSYILKPFMTSNYMWFVEKKTGKKWEDLSENEKQQYQNEWITYQKTDKKDDVELAAQGYINMMKTFAPQLLEQIRQMQKVVLDKEHLQILNNFQKQFQGYLLDPENPMESYERWMETISDEQKWLEFVLGNIDIDTVSGENARDYIEQFNDNRNLYIDTTNQIKQIQEEKARVAREELLNIYGGETPEFFEDFERHIAKYNQESDEAHKEAEQLFINKMQSLIQAQIFDNAMRFALGFIDLGYINEAIKPLIINSLKEHVNILKKAADAIDEGLNPEDIELEETDLEDFEEEGFEEEVPENYIKPWESEQSTQDLRAQIRELENSIRTIEELPSSPIIQNLDSFGLHVLGSNVKLSELLQYLEQSFEQNKGDISQFTLGDLKIATQEALNMIEMYMAALEGARNDSLHFDALGTASVNVETGNIDVKDTTNLWNINATLNEIHRKQPKPKVDTWEDLPEISGEGADMMLKDAKVVYDRLVYFKKLHDINTGQKLNTQIRVSTNLQYLQYQHLRRLCDVVPDEWEGKEILVNALDSAEVTKRNFENGKPLSTSLTEQTAMERERIAIETAVYDFFNDSRNASLFNSVEKLSELFNAKNFNFYTNKQVLVNEGTEALDDHSFVAWLAAKAALRSEDYHPNFKEIIGTDKAPLASQEIGVYMNVASTFNGDVLQRFLEAVKLSILNDLRGEKDFNKRKQKFIDAGSDPLSAAFSATEVMMKYVENSSFMPQYSHITFVEGIPGAGKSDGVDYYTIKFLQRYGKEILNNPFVVHVDEESAKSFGKNINFEESAFLAHDRVSLMKYFFEDWKDFEEDKETGGYKLTKTDIDIDVNGRIYPKFKLKNLNPELIPSIIVIDEISRFTHLDLMALDLAAKKYGFSIITSGDLDQSQSRGRLTNFYSEEDASSLLEEIKNIPELASLILSKDNLPTYTIEISRNSFLHSPKLGTSLRTAYKVKTSNGAKMQLQVGNYTGDTIYLDYYQDDKVLAGDKVYNMDDKGGLDYLSPEKIAQIVKDAKFMISQLGENEKIGFIYYSEQSKLYEELSKLPEFESKFEKFKGNSAQGKEANYWIIETNPQNASEPSGFKTYLQDLYTGITRARKASIIIAPSIKSSGSNVNVGSNPPVRILEEEKLPPKAIEKFAEKRKKILDEVCVSNPKPLTPTPRTLQDVEINLGKTKTPEEILKEQEENKEKVRQEQAENQKLLENLQEVVRKEQEEDLAEQAEEETEQPESSLEELITALKQSANAISFTDLINSQDLNCDVQVNSEGNMVVKFFKKDGMPYYLAVPRAFWLKGIDDLSVYNPAQLQYLLDFNKSTDLVSTIIVPKDNPTLLTIMPLEGNPYRVSISTFDIFENQLALKEDEEDPKDLEIIPETDEPEVGTVEEVREKAVKETVESPGNGEESDLDTLNTGAASEALQMLGFTHAAFEFGAPLDLQNNTFDYSWETVLVDGKTKRVLKLKTPGAEYRIDGINGLVKIYKKLVESKQALPNDLRRITNPLAMLLLIADLGGKALNTDSKEDLINYIKGKLNLPNVNITFAIKNYSLDLEEMQAATVKDPSYWKFFKDREQEKAYFSEAGSIGAENVLGRNLIMIIGDSEGDLLEIPLITLNNPITLLQYLAKNNNLYARVYNYLLSEIHKLAQSAGGERKAEPLAITNTITAFRGLGQYKSILDLLQFYLVTDRTVFFIDDNEWLPSTGFINEGPQIFQHKGEDSDIWEYAAEYGQRTKWIDLETFVNNPRIHSSRVMQYMGTDGYVQIDNNRKIKVFKTGVPFILYSTDPDLSTDEQLRLLYIKQAISAAEGVPFVPKVKLIRVTTPTVTFEEYVNSIINFYDNVRNNPKYPKPIGNDRTAFRVLKTLWDSEEGKKALNKMFEGYWKDSPNVKIHFERMLQEVASLPEGLQAKKLRENCSYNLLGKEGTYKELFENFIKQLVKTTGLNNIMGEDPETVDEAYFNVLKDAWASTGKSIWYSAKLLSSDTNQGKFAYVRTGNNPWEIENLHGIADSKFKILGTLSPPMYRFLINDFITPLLNKVKKVGVFDATSDNLLYLNNNSANLTTPQGSGVKFDYSDRLKGYIDELPDNLKSGFIEHITTTYPPTSKDFESEEIEKELIDMFNDGTITELETGIAFKLPNGDLVLSNTGNLALAGRKEITTPISVSEGKYKFTLNINGTNYDASYKDGTLEITEIIPETESLQTTTRTIAAKPEVNSNTLQSWSDLIDEMLRDSENSTLDEDLLRDTKDVLDALINQNITDKELIDALLTDTYLAPEDFEDYLDFFREYLETSGLKETSSGKDLINSILGFEEVLEDNKVKCPPTIEIKLN